MDSEIPQRAPQKNGPFLYARCSFTRVHICARLKKGCKTNIMFELSHLSGFKLIRETDLTLS